MIVIVSRNPLMVRGQQAGFCFSALAHCL